MGKADWDAMNRRGEGKAPHAHAVQDALLAQGALRAARRRQTPSSAPTSRKTSPNLWKEDVYEFFLWPDEATPIYFEYEISPLGRELPILVPNLGGEFLGWRPWHYEGERKTRKAVSVRGGEVTTGAAIKGWTAEVFVPYELLSPLRQRAAEARHPLAGELLPHGLRRRRADAPGTGRAWARASTSTRSLARWCLSNLQFRSAQ